VSKKIAALKEDSLLDEEEGTAVSGVVGGCYCCSQNIHITSDQLIESPVAIIEGSYFYMLLCDLCERDVLKLRELGVSQVSYDILWLIQENLVTELYNLENKQGEISEEERDKILYRLYMESDKSLESQKTKMYLSRFAYVGDDDKGN